jgi:hypothetical protein
VLFGLTSRTNGTIKFFDVSKTDSRDWILSQEMLVGLTSISTNNDQEQSVRRDSSIVGSSMVQ